MRRFGLLLAALAVCGLTGCSAATGTGATPSGSGTTVTVAAVPAPSTTVSAAPRSSTPSGVDYAAAAKRDIDENICVIKAAGCSDISRYGMLVDALVAYTDLYPDSDATAPAASICSYLLEYVIDSKTSSDELSSTAYVYDRNGQHLTKCTTPLDR